MLLFFGGGKWLKDFLGRRVQKILARSHMATER